MSVTMAKKKSIDIEEVLKPKPVPWRDFEAEVAAHVQKAVDDFTLGLSPKHSKVIAKPKYKSLWRRNDVVFDVSIEMWQNELADRPTLIWIWECKNYETHNVGVAEVEEFHSKLQQVGAHKGTVVTRKGFDSGAVDVAKALKIGLATLRQETMTTIMFSQDAGIRVQTVAKCDYCLTSTGDNYAAPYLEDYVFSELEAAGFEQPD